jgi:hypothetical protein
MPQATEELRAEWPGHDQQAMAHLEAAGYRLERDWTWTRPQPGHQPSERDWSAIRYLIDEWDFGGLRSLDDDPCRF